MSERRYDDEETREIFRLATTGSPRDRTLPAESNGLTLAELERIAREVGIEPSRVAHAAATVDARGQAAPVKRMLGMPIGVTRVVDLPRAPTDHEWELLVTELRSVFEAQGEVTTTGAQRAWSNGNLHVSIEPTERGQQLRMTTRNEGGVVLNAFGILMGLMSAIMTASVAAAGKPEKALALLGMFGGMSLAAFLTNVVRLPGWSRTRARQMEALAEHAVGLLSKR